MTDMETKELAQCDSCDYICEWSDVEYVNDSYSDNTISCCPKCNAAESFNNYEEKTA
jgi:hypothetical protein